MNSTTDVNQNIANRSRLGVAIGDQHWLIDLAEAGEILPIPEAVSHVPATKPWFFGLANLRGALFGVADLAVFQGRDRTQCGKDARLLAFSESLGLNASILVSRMMGLQNLESMTMDATVEPAGWAGNAWVDGAGAQWRELHLSKLCIDENFLAVNR